MMKTQLKHYYLCSLLLPCYSFAQTHTDAEDHDHHAKRHHEAHVHGVVTFNLSQEKNTLLLEINAPGHDVIGIEHDPQNKKELTKLKQTLLKLSNSASAIGLPKAADCTVKDTKVQHNYALTIANDHHDKHEGHHDHKHFEISYELTCKQIDQAKNIPVNWFNNFSATQTIQLNTISAVKQSSTQLKPKNAIIKL